MHSCAERRDLQLSRAAPRARARRATRFRTRSDTEVHLHLYEQHGPDFARRLRGMFAVAIWDAKRRRVVLARDRYGIKPLYYRHVGGVLEFASELRALPRGEIDLDALEAFLAFNSIPAPYSIFREIRKLPPGHVLVWEESGTMHIDRYARPGPVPVEELRTEDEAELIEELRARLRDSVRAHLLSDVPVGVLLSGGVDSAALAALAAQESSGPDPHVHDRLRRAKLRRARRRTTRRRALRDEPPRAAHPPRPDAAAARPRRSIRRAVRGLVGAADVPRVAARGRAREGRALGRGRRRALRRLLHVRGRPARRPDRPACAHRATVRRTASDLDVEGELRLPREALRPGRAPPAARAPPRLEGDLLRRGPHRADGAHRALRPGRRLPAALPRDAGGRRPLPPPGRRLRDLPRRRPAREDRPCVDGALARGARAVPRPGGGGLRVRPLDPPQGARALEEGTAAQGSRAARPARSRARPQARLLDSGRGVAARRAPAVRPRDALRRDAPAPGLLPSRDGDRA